MLVARLERNTKLLALTSWISFISEGAIRSLCFRLYCSIHLLTISSLRCSCILSYKPWSCGYSEHEEGRKTYVNLFRLKQGLLAKEMGGYSESEDVCAQLSKTIGIAILLIHGCRRHAQGVMCEYVEKQINISFNLWQRRKASCGHLDERLVVDVRYKRPDELVCLLKPLCGPESHTAVP